MTDNQIVRNEIITSIQRLAKDAGGVPPGQKKFATETGIKDHIWRAKIWLNWTDALAEAGFGPLKWIEAISDETLLLKASKLAKRLGHFPSQAELKFECANNSDFPSINAIKRRWSMSEFADATLKFAELNNDLELASYAQKYLTEKPTNKVTAGTIEQKSAKGHVYMQKVGDKFRIGQTNSIVGRYRQVQMETPTRVEYVHTILTDDPLGVEAYWHKRFQALKLPINGDWFALKPSDIAAFKRWKKIW
jgi:hypothetical protein